MAKKSTPKPASGTYTVIEDNVYRRRIYMFIGSRSELKAHLKELWPGGKAVKAVASEDVLGQMFHFRWEFARGVKTRVYYIWSVKFDDSEEDIGTLAHEAFHVACEILNDLGVDTSDSDGSESIAYYFESIFMQSLAFARKQLLEVTEPKEQ